MAVFSKKLYENILEIEAMNFSHLDVITGYSSGDFLKKVTTDFPLLNLKVFIGMSTQGISQEDHRIYQNLTLNSNSVKVYYQIEGVPTHIKLLKFSDEFAESTYIGSANFSSNGFGDQKEIMAKVHFDSQIFFVEQERNSLLCTSDEVANYIDFYKVDNRPQFTFEQEVNYELSSLEKNIENPVEKNIALIKKWRNSLSYKQYNSVEVEIVKEKEHDPRWSTSGINGIFGDGESYLRQGPGKSFSEVLPSKERFKIITDDGITIEAELFGAFSKKIRFIEFDILNYIRNRIGVFENRPICKTDLDLYGRNTILFEKLDEGRYILNFEVS